MIGIIDYGMGNLLSVRHALTFLGAKVKVCESTADLGDIDRIVLPGVGAFGDCVRNLRQRGFIKPLNDMVIRDGMPILGICLGMQVMARKSLEGGEHEGLGWIDGDVILIQPEDPSLRVPHVGWNEVHYRKNSPLFDRLPVSCDLYFVHSYFVDCDDKQVVDATCQHGLSITAAIRKNNIFATQFHPEKSQDYGLRILKNFLSWKP
jgi:imidazole glycerol-phosphate synthase subunit HisH